MPDPPGRRKRPSLLVTMVSLAGLVLLGGVLIPTLVQAFHNRLPQGSQVPAGASRGTLAQRTLDAAAGRGVVAVAVDSDTAYSAIASTNGTTVTAYSVGSGDPRWRTVLPVRPVYLALHRVGGLLVVDAGRSAMDAGKDIRLVLDAGTGHQRWKGDWTQRVDVAYVGTDALVAQDGLSTGLSRVDLGTGATRWTRSDSVDASRASARIRPVLSWPANGGPAGPAVAPPTRAFQESLAVDADVLVELNARTGTGVVLSTATGRPVRTGHLPLAGAAWTVFDGVVLGALSEAASPGVPAVGGYRLDTLAPAWPPLTVDPGDDIQAVGPCGLGIVCVSVKRYAGGGNRLIGVEVATGAQKWERDFPFSFTPGWRIVGGLTVLGEGSFDDHLGGPRDRNEVIDPATGQSTRALGDKRNSPYVQGASGSFAVLVGTGFVHNIMHWYVWLVDLSTNRWYGAIDVGVRNPQVLAVAGHTVIVLDNDRTIRVGTPSRK